jgi:hydroxyacylglutathione hydrolase
MKVAAALLVSIFVLGACGTNPHLVKSAKDGATIGSMKLAWSNAHVVFGSHPLIVDSGAQGDFADLTAGLRELGAPLGSIRCAVITHAHADHAGTARALQLAGVTIIAGAADVDRTWRGVHGPHHPTGLFARMLKWFLPDHYKPFVADIVVTDRYDLAPCGIDGEVIATPGHTPGAVVVLVAHGKIALVGDLFRGGLVFTTSPAEHFYQDDLKRDHAQIQMLLARGVEWFVLGHGGPIGRKRVQAKFGR